MNDLSTVSPDNPLFPEDPANYYRSPFLPLGGPVDPKTGNVEAGRREWAWPGFVRNMANELALTTTAPGNVLGGRLTPSPELAAHMGLELGGLGLGAGFATGAAKDASLGIFAGPKAATADTAALGRAMSMESAGADRGAIHSATGWFKGPDDKWRFVVPDVGAHIWPSGRSDVEAGNPVDLKDFLGHRALYETYPDIGSQIGVYRTPPGSRNLGDWSPWANMLRINFDKYHPGPNGILGTTLHEVQHAIQNKEGFAEGGSNSEFMGKWTPESLETAITNLTNQQYTKGAQLPRGVDQQQVWDAGFDNDPSKIDLRYRNLPEVRELFDISQRQATLQRLRHQAFLDYQNLAGEVESRAVEHQLAHKDWGMPFGQEGYPTGPQILKFGGKIVSGSRPLSKFSFEPVEEDPFGGHGP